MKFEKIKSHAKINLSLNVLGKKKSKLHNLETLVGFLDLHDDIYIKKTNKKNHIIKFTGNFSNKIPKKNTISNLLKILDEAKKLKNQKVVRTHAEQENHHGVTRLRVGRWTFEVDVRSRPRRTF